MPGNNNTLLAPVKPLLVSPVCFAMLKFVINKLGQLFEGPGKTYVPWYMATFVFFLKEAW